MNDRAATIEGLMALGVPANRAESIANHLGPRAIAWVAEAYLAQDYHARKKTAPTRSSNGVSLPKRNPGPRKPDLSGAYHG